MTVQLNNETNDLKKSIAQGVKMLSDAVGVTLGPFGRNVVLKGVNGFPEITKDGVSVAKKVNHPQEPIAQLGIDMVKEVSLRANEEGGDGTTTATVIAGQLVHEALDEKYKESNVMEMRQGIVAASEFILHSLNEMAVECRSYDYIRQAAAISANGDNSIAEVIAEQIIDFKDSLSSIHVQKGKTEKDQVEVIKGYSINRGWFNPNIVSQGNQLLELENPYIFLIENECKNLDAFNTILSSVPTGGQALVIADGFSDDIILTCINFNRTRNGKTIGIVRTPEHANRKAQTMQDLAAYLGTTVHSVIGDNGDGNTFGTCSKVIISQKDTKFFHGDNVLQEVKDCINNRIDEIDEYLKRDNLDRFDIEHSYRRRSMLRDGLCFIKAGGATDLSTEERYRRYEDAVNASINAYREGVVAGGGSALYRIASDFFTNKDDYYQGLDNPTPDFKQGFELAMSAIQRPLNKIFANAGKDPSDYIEGIESGDDSTTYNLRTGVVGQMFDIDVIDPVVVTKSSVKYALDIAGLILTTEAAVFHDY